MSTHVLIEEMTWPTPGKRLDELEWTLRYGNPTRADLLVAASVCAAYRQMVHDPAKKRAEVIKELREAAREEWERA